MVQFAESSYRFTDPIRYFKANDPIYYEVENIPLKQLQENDLWLKDQIEKLNVGNAGTSVEGEIDRNYFSELKPYVDGTDNIVYVKPGKFTARINDAYNITPLQLIQSLTGSGINSDNTWYVKTLNDSTISSIIYKFQTNSLANGIGMNGLAERAFSYPASIPDRVSQYLLSSFPNISNIGESNDVRQPPYPLLQAQLFSNFTRLGENGEDRTDYVIKQYDSGGNTLIGFATLPAAEVEFIKRWRGIARTAVVDVSEELSIEIPKFDENDFSYIDDAGNTQLLTNATQRIDLVFIYSKPVDMSGTTIAKFNSTGLPTTITKPALGIVKGAGVGVDYSYQSRAFKKLKSAVIPTTGNLKMLAHIGDQAATNIGFIASGVEIGGSFPSPDDLMNLTPILDEELTTNHYGLIGQSVLPIAYVVVKKNAILNELNQPIIENTSIIDIRPFFRTTELSYNERAGIAAAVPAPSLANPVVTQAELGYEINRAYKDLLNKIPVIPPDRGQLPAMPRPIAVGYVLGGLKYGVEGVLANYLAENGGQGQSETQIAEFVRNKYNYASSIDIPIYPDWDISEWLKRNPNTTQIGNQVNDRINLYMLFVDPIRRFDRTWVTNNLIRGSSYPIKYGTSRKSSSSWTAGQGYSERIGYPAQTRDHNSGPFIQFYFVRKKIFLSTLPSWVVDYEVNVKLLNCLSLTGRINENGGSNSIWVEKGKENGENFFVINIAWTAKPVGLADNTVNNSWNQEDYFCDLNLYARTNTNMPGLLDMDIQAGNTRQEVQSRKGLDPSKYRDVGELTSGWLVTNSDIIKVPFERDTERGNVTMGVCNYPSVMFNVIGYPAACAPQSVTSQGNNPSTIIVG